MVVQRTRGILKLKIGNRHRGSDASSHWSKGFRHRPNQQESPSVNGRGVKPRSNSAVGIRRNGFFSRHQSVLECFQHQVCSWISRPDSPRHPSSELSYWQLSYKCAWYPAGRMMLRSDYHSRMEQPKYRHDSLPSHYISFVGDHYDCGATIAAINSMNQVHTSASGFHH